MSTGKYRVYTTPVFREKLAPPPHKVLKKVKNLEPLESMISLKESIHQSTLDPIEESPAPMSVVDQPEHRSKMELPQLKTLYQPHSPTQKKPKAGPFLIFRHETSIDSGSQVLTTAAYPH